MHSIAFDRRLTIAVPADLHRAIRVAASARGQSVADLVRAELQTTLVRARIPFEPVPDLERSAPARAPK